MSKMATARIPDEIYDQGLRQLSAMGRGTSDLIKAAFDYVSRTGKLPEVPVDESVRARNISKEQKADLAAKLRASRMHIELPADWDVREELAAGKRADYEALA